MLRPKQNRTTSWCCCVRVRVRVRTAGGGGDSWGERRVPGLSPALSLRQKPGSQAKAGIRSLAPREQRSGRGEAHTCACRRSVRTDLLRGLIAMVTQHLAQGQLSAPGEGRTFLSFKVGASRVT